MKFTCDTNGLVDVLRDSSVEQAFGTFLSRFSHLTYLSAVVILELRAGARTPGQVKLLEQEVVQRFARANRVFHRQRTPSRQLVSCSLHLRIVKGGRPTRIHRWCTTHCWPHRVASPA